MNTQEILTRLNEACKLCENKHDAALFEELARELREQLRTEIARNAGNGNATKTLRAFLKAQKNDARESLRYPWIDDQGRECYCDGYRAFRMNNPLRLVECPKNAGKTIDLGRIYPDSLTGWKELTMPTIAEIKEHIALQRANGVQRRAVLWRFGPNRPTVSAVYLLDAAMVFPDADRIFWNTIVTPLVIGGRDGDGLILPVRVKGETQPEPANDEERKAREAYDAKQEAIRREELERAKAICEAHDREHAANLQMDQAAARCQVLEKGVKNASNDNLRDGLMDQLTDARREFARASIERHAAILEYDPDVSMDVEQFETLMKMLYGELAA